MRATPPSQDPSPPRHHSGSPSPGPQGEPTGADPLRWECSQPAVTGRCGLLSRARSLGGGWGLG